MPSPAPPSRPSGQQHTLRFGTQVAVVVEVGGGLRTYEVGGIPVVDGYGPDEMCGSGRGQVLIPFPNRIQDGAYRFEGAELQLPLSEVSKHNASHGLVRWVNWMHAFASEDSVRLTHRIHPQPGYPFTVDLTLTYTLGPAGLTAQVDATNVGARPCPYGFGAHPYFTLGTRTVDELELHVRARERMLPNDRGIPGEAELLEKGSALDFSEPKRIGGQVIDATLIGLERDAQDRAWVWLRTPSNGRSLGVWMDGTCDCVQLFTGDTLPQVPRRRQGFAIEPMTCAPNAFRTGVGLRVLQPGETFTTRWGVQSSLLEGGSK